MCGIAGIIQLNGERVFDLEHKLGVMNTIQAHRGPDGEGVWSSEEQSIGFAHRRLSIIDIESGNQPMSGACGNTITFNGEIYNYKELKSELAPHYSFKTESDTEVILAAYKHWGEECLSKFRGMFAFAIWDEQKHKLFCARDHFGIKPFYYTQNDGQLFFASEAKTLLPFIDEFKVDSEALKDYLTFQLCLDGKTLFHGIKELVRGHKMTIEKSKVEINHYWEIYYKLDWSHNEEYFKKELEQKILESVELHLRSDVPVGAYLSGGIDSGIISALAQNQNNSEVITFHGKFTDGGALFDESHFAQAQADKFGLTIHQQDITKDDFINNIEKVIYHLDYPVAGPGSFPQYMISGLASKHRKVVLGGQGGDEIFGGYTRYLIAYFEQCIKGAIDGTLNDGKFVVTYESIIENLKSLRNYKPLMRHMWKEDLFGEIDKRYYRLINRAPNIGNEVNWNDFSSYDTFPRFSKIFNRSNVGKESYFDQMTHFDFKTLLPALLHVEDRMSMAHGIESRVPFIDKEIVEFAATMPANIKFKNGKLKKILSETMNKQLCPEIINRPDKMGFPVPLNNWIQNGDLNEYLHDVFGSSKANSREFINNKQVLENLENESTFGRKIWGFLSLELWQREFNDKFHEYKKLIR